jgi:hypothetical protein
VHEPTHRPTITLEMVPLPELGSQSIQVAADGYQITDAGQVLLWRLLDDGRAVKSCCPST